MFGAEQEKGRMNVTSNRLSRWTSAIFTCAMVSIGYDLMCGVAFAAGVVDVTNSMTTTGNPAQDYIVNNVERRLAGEPGVTGAFVAVVWGRAWSPQLMSLAAEMHVRINEDLE